MDKNLQYTLSLKDLFSNKMKDAENATSRMDSKVSGLGSRLASLGIAMGSAFAVKSIVSATTKFQSLENAINATGEGRGAQNLKFLNEQVDRLGMDITAAYSGYKTFSGALMGTTLAGEQGNKVFRQVSEAATVMGLSGEQSEGAFLALGQMMSKGTVSAEELRGQLGERIPGAFQIAAKAMGVTTKALGVMMQKGELVATDFLPKFGNELEKRFGSQAVKASHSLQSELNRMGTEFERLKVQLGNDFLPVILSVTKGIASLFKWIKDNLSTIKSVASSILIAVTAFYAYKSILAVTTIAQYALNTAMTLNPLGLVIAAVALLVLHLKELYENYERIKGQFQKKETDMQSIYFKSQIENTRKLADSYEKLGMSKKDAEGKAISETSSKIDANLNKMKGKDGYDYAKKLANTTKKGLAGIFDKKGADAGSSSPTSASIGSLASKSADTKSGGTEISGTKPQSLVINITKLVESLNINTTNLKESASRIREEVSKALLETVNDVNMVAR